MIKLNQISAGIMYFKWKFVIKLVMRKLTNSKLTVFILFSNSEAKSLTQFLHIAVFRFGHLN